MTDILKALRNGDPEAWLDPDAILYLIAHPTLATGAAMALTRSAGGDLYPQVRAVLCGPVAVWWAHCASLVDMVTALAGLAGAGHRGRVIVVGAVLGLLRRRVPFNAYSDVANAGLLGRVSEWLEADFAGDAPEVYGPHPTRHENGIRWLVGIVEHPHSATVALPSVADAMTQDRAYGAPAYGSEDELTEALRAAVSSLVDAADRSAR